MKRSSKEHCKLTDHQFLTTLSKLALYNYILYSYEANTSETVLNYSVENH